ncbi:MAG: hypothetical protein PW786_14700 [Arachidicoccus sp.]|nr:hypothetical protein [Arachidicoccus sp.]
MKKIFVTAIISVLTVGALAQDNKKFSKPKEETSTRYQHQQGHLIDQDTYEFDKDNHVKIGDTLLVGSPSGPKNFEFISEKKGILGFANFDKIKNLVHDVSPDAGNAMNKAQHNDVTYKVGDIKQDVNALKGPNPNLKFSEQAKKLMNKKLVVTHFEEKDYGNGVKDVLATATDGKKKYIIVLTSALLEHEIYLSE